MEFLVPVLLAALLGAGFAAVHLLHARETGADPEAPRSHDHARDFGCIGCGGCGRKARGAGGARDDACPGATGAGGPGPGAPAPDGGAREPSPGG